MIDAEKFLALLQDRDIDFFVGVPDSLLQPLLKEINSAIPDTKHYVAVNEGQAVSLAQGHFLQSGKLSLVYMQNSGLGNALNPLLSMASSMVYSIPMILMIGWRGEPNIHDEPQHLHQGLVTEELLQISNIPYLIIDNEASFDAIDYLLLKAVTKQRPVALLVKKNVICSKKKLVPQRKYRLRRKDIMRTITQRTTAPIVATTGHTSRELFELRNEAGVSHVNDFLSVGGMGHLISIALGFSIEHTGEVFCFDGDGAFLMHMGSPALLCKKRRGIIKHIVFDNEAHLSVGGMPTASKNIDIMKIAGNLGYNYCKTITTKDELIILDEFLSHHEDAFLLIKISDEPENKLIRPDKSPHIAKHEFINSCKGDSRLLIGDIENNISLVLKETNSKSVLIIGNNMKDSLVTSLECTDVEVTVYSGYEANPKLADINKIMQIKDHSNFDLIIAIGGGSALDSAKIIREYFCKTSKLVTIPTTCGTGAEITPFAVCYENGIKQSIQTKCADYVILDGSIVAKTPLTVLNAPILDAVVQAIESIWAKSATSESQRYAYQALNIFFTNLLAEIEKECNYSELLYGSYLCGRAIAISKTTACHAMSYGLTSHYGIRHGEAVAILLPYFIKHHFNAGDNRLKKLINNIFCIAEVNSLDEFLKFYNQLVKSVGLSAKINGECDLKSLMRLINLERLANNPVKITETLMQDIYRQIFIPIMGNF
jgi:phosphonopyruvate decarboxylase